MVITKENIDKVANFVDEQVQISIWILVIFLALSFMGYVVKMAYDAGAIDHIKPEQF